MGIIEEYIEVIIEGRARNLFLRIDEYGASIGGASGVEERDYT